MPLQHPPGLPTKLRTTSPAPSNLWGSPNLLPVHGSLPVLGSRIGLGPSFVHSSNARLLGNCANRCSPPRLARSPGNPSSASVTLAVVAGFTSSLTPPPPEAEASALVCRGPQRKPPGQYFYGHGPGWRVTGMRAWGAPGRADGARSFHARARRRRPPPSPPDSECERRPRPTPAHAPPGRLAALRPTSARPRRPRAIGL